MSSTTLHLFRHGQTDWNITTQHTGRTDLPLNARGVADAEALKHRIAHLRFDHVFTSTLSRARDTCAIVGLLDGAEQTDELWEWHYGAWEGRTRAEIVAEYPGWDLWTQGAPGGESPEQVIARVDGVLDRICAGSVTAMFAHGHLLRVVACRWLGWPLTQARALLLGNCAHSVLVRDADGSALQAWNQLGEPPRGE